MADQFDREFLLKAVQAWLNLKLKIAGFVALVNAAAIATAVTVLKDNPTSATASNALSLGMAGLFLGATAICSISLLGEKIIETMIQYAGVKGKRIDASALAHPVVSKIIWLLVMCSFSCLGFSVAFLQGYTDGGIMCEKNPSVCGAKPSAQKPAISPK